MRPTKEIQAPRTFFFLFLADEASLGAGGPGAGGDGGSVGTLGSRR
jgi:hypothetical protein